MRCDVQAPWKFKRPKNSVTRKVVIFVSTKIHADELCNKLWDSGSFVLDRLRPPFAEAVCGSEDGVLVRRKIT